MTLRMDIELYFSLEVLLDNPGLARYVKVGSVGTELLSGARAANKGGKELEAFRAVYNRKARVAVGGRNEKVGALGLIPTITDPRPSRRSDSKIRHRGRMPSSGLLAIPSQ